MRRLAVVTGASSGIGKETAAMLRQKGFRVVGLSRHLPEGPATRRCDVSNEASVRRCFQTIQKRYGTVDILVNAAGKVASKPSLRLQRQDWHSLLDVNLIGTYFCCKHALPSMARRGYGKIVTISSQAGRTFSPTASLAYTCSKYGVIGLTRQLAAEFAPRGININCVCPSQTNTEMLKTNLTKAQRNKLVAGMPMGRLAEPYEIAEVIAFLVSDQASYVNGAVLDVHGAQI